MAYADESNRQTPAKRARRVFIDRIDDAENRKVEAEMNYHEAGGAWKEADKRRDAAVADQHRAHLDRQAASADQHRANIDRQRSVEELHSAMDELRDYDEEMKRLDKEEEDK